MEMSARKPLLPRRVLDLPIDALRPNPNQPRIEFDEASLRSLSDSIRRYGILQPLTVRRTDEGYELIAGERRLRAGVQADMQREDTDDGILLTIRIPKRAKEAG